MIPQHFITDLLNRVDVVDVVGRYVTLKKGGANFMGLCPFHHEKSPSFTVSPAKQFYHCFGCGAHGTAISFLMEYSGLSFPDAVNELAQSCGMIVPQEPSGLSPQQQAQKKAESTSLVEILAQAAAFYKQALRATPRAVDYLKQRGVSGEVARDYGLGYAPDAWDGLRGVFVDYSRPELQVAGLVINKEQGDKRYDRFRDRIMFPIRNVRGEVIAFGGRVIDQGEPKYLNSPETPVFSKGSELYGLFEARQAIRQAGYVLVVEGYMDVVALAQSGLPNAVATLGTACSAVHVQKLLRQTDRVVFSFDGDLAGRKAAWRALEAALPLAADDKLLSFLFLPTEHDPDTYVREFGTAAFQQEVERALPLSQFLLRELTTRFDLNTAEGRARLQLEAKPLLQAMPFGALRAQIIRELAQIAQLDAREFAQLAGIRSRWDGGPGGRFHVPAAGRKTEMLDLELRLARDLIAAPVAFSALSDEDRVLLTESEALLGELARWLVGRLGQPGLPHLAEISAVLGESDYAPDLERLLRQIMGSDSPTGAPLLTDETLAVANLQAGVIKLRLARLRLEMNEISHLAEPGAEDLERLRNLQKVLRDLEARQLELRRNDGK
jgi:DNA primase